VLLVAGALLLFVSGACERREGEGGREGERERERERGRGRGGEGTGGVRERHI